MPPIPITIITGFLGSGKTTLILNLIPQLRRQNPSYRLALLKNEFGDVAIDSQLAANTAISGVSELLHGCICCNLVGQLGPALAELERVSTTPTSTPTTSTTTTTTTTTTTLDRIIIETSGSAFPATLALEINRLAREPPTAGRYVLDGVVSVIDVENWPGYADTSYTARIQARYTDLVVLNKWEAAGEDRLETCLDRLGDIDVDVARVRSDAGRVPVDLVFGIDGALARNLLPPRSDDHHHHYHTNDDIKMEKNGHSHDHDHNHQTEVEVLSIEFRSPPTTTPTKISSESLANLLAHAPKDQVYRIKAILSLDATPRNSDPDLPPPPPDATRYILNWAFGRWTFTPLLPPSTTAPAEEEPADMPPLRMTMILARCESAKWKKKLEAGGLIEAAGPNSDGELIVKRIL